MAHLPDAPEQQPSNVIQLGNLPYSGVVALYRAVADPAGHEALNRCCAMNDDQPHCGTPGLGRRPAGPAPHTGDLYRGWLAIQIAMVLVVAAIALVMSRME